MEGDKKVTNPEQVRLRRIIELREYALAASYPLMHSGISAHHERAVDRLPVIAAGPLGDNHPTDVAAECRKAAAQDAVTPQGKRLQQLIREHGDQRSLDEPKPWKKPWDK